MKLEEIAMNIICNSGECRSFCFEALEDAKKSDFESADEKMQKAKEKFLEAHKYQTELITREASGNKVDMTVLVVHAQDHLMSSMLAMDLIREIIELYNSARH